MSRFDRVVVVLLSICLPALVSAGDWPHLRGPEFDGRGAAAGLLDGNRVGLEVAWKASLGPGYSGITVADGRAVTMFSDGVADYVIAFDAESGKEIWRKKIAPTNKGRDGSDDGPLSTAIIDDGVVFALGPMGQLLALGLSDGASRWSKALPKDFGSTDPHFGFTTTPLVEGKVLVVETGGSEGRAICGLDKSSGDRLWCVGDDTVTYQSPAVMTLAGRRQVVAIDDKKIIGLAPESGEVLWKHAFGENAHADSASPTPIGDDRFLAFVNGKAVAFGVKKTAEGYGVEEVYQSGELGGSYAMPVYHDGYLYGFKGQFLTCVDAATGERVWKSRPPGGKGLILVDDHLVIYGAKGTVVVAEATPASYQESARIEALGGSALTWPSFADGKVFVRNLEEIASISLTRDEQPVRDDAIAASSDSETSFGRFVTSVAKASDGQSMVSEFIESQQRIPIIENDYVHFVYRGEVEDIAITGTMVASGHPEPMEHVKGTDLYYKTYRLRSGGRWEYQFNVNYGENVADPLNPRTVPAFQGPDPLSEVAMPDYGTATDVSEAGESPRGRIDSFKFKSEQLGNERDVKVYLPSGYDDSDRSYPVLIINDGLEWVDKGLMVNTLDDLTGKSFAPVVVVFFATIPQWWFEAGGSNTDGYVKMLAEELVPHLEERYRLVSKADSRALMGNVFHGLSAAYGAFKYPEVFGKVAVQSPYLGLGAGDALSEMIREGEPGKVEIYLDWNLYESRSPDDGWDLYEDSTELAELLRENGHTFAGGEVLDSFGWGGWRSRSDDVLEALFPVE